MNILWIVVYYFLLYVGVCVLMSKYVYVSCVSYGFVCSASLCSVQVCTCNDFLVVFHKQRKKIHKNIEQQQPKTIYRNCGWFSKRGFSNCLPHIYTNSQKVNWIYRNFFKVNPISTLAVVVIFAQLLRGAVATTVANFFPPHTANIAKYISAL